MFLAKIFMLCFFFFFMTVNEIDQRLFMPNFRAFHLNAGKVLYVAKLTARIYGPLPYVFKFIPRYLMMAK